MLKRYIKDTVKTELTKQKLNAIYGSARSYNLNSVSDKERQDLNEQISTLKNYHNNMVERNRYLKSEIDKLKRENEPLKQEIEQLKECREIDFKARLQSGFQLEELKQENEELEQENEKLKKENEQLKNLSCSIVIDNDGKLDSLFNKQLRKENEQLKESIKNLGGTVSLKDNLLNEKNKEIEQLKEANSDLTKNLFKIESVIAYYESIKPDYYVLLELVENIKNILKES